MGKNFFSANSWALKSYGKDESSGCDWSSEWIYIGGVSCGWFLYIHALECVWLRPLLWVHGQCDGSLCSPGRHRHVHYGSHTCTNIVQWCCSVWFSMFSCTVICHLLLVCNLLLSPCVYACTPVPFTHAHAEYMQGVVYETNRHQQSSCKSCCHDFHWALMLCCMQ